MTKFKKIVDECGLSLKGASRLLNVRYDTVKNWNSGKCAPPAGVMKDLNKLNTAVKRIFVSVDEK